jgi:hypothetical protein
MKPKAADGPNSRRWLARRRNPLPGRRRNRLHHPTLGDFFNTLLSALSLSVAAPILGGTAEGVSFQLTEHYIKEAEARHTESAKLNEHLRTLNACLPDGTRDGMDGEQEEAELF